MTATSATETPPRRSWRFLASPGWIGGILAVLAFTTVCWAVLAPWQFSRHTERGASNAQVAAAVNAESRPVERAAVPDREPDAASTWQPATATGVFEPEHQVYVRLRQDAGGAPASEVVVPLRLPDGTAVLVDRGYVSATDTIKGDAPRCRQLPTGTVTVTGRVQPDQPDPLDRPAQVTDGRTDVLGIDGRRHSRLTGPVRQGFLQLVDGSPAVLTPIGVPQVDEGPFLSYALQWCAFGGMALLAIGFFVVREYRDPRPAESPAAEESAAGVGRRSSVVPADRRPAASNGRRSRRFDRSQLYDRAEATTGTGRTVRERSERPRWAGPAGRAAAENAVTDRHLRKLWMYRGPRSGWSAGRRPRANDCSATGTTGGRPICSIAWSTPSCAPPTSIVAGRSLVSPGVSGCATVGDGTTPTTTTWPGWDWLCSGRPWWPILRWPNRPACWPPGSPTPGRPNRGASRGAGATNIATRRPTARRRFCWRAPGM